MLSLVSIYMVTMKKDDLWINVHINFDSEDHDGTGGQESEHDVTTAQESERDVTTAQEIQLDQDVHNVFEMKKKKKKKHKQQVKIIINTLLAL